MKKAILLVLALALIFTMAACGGKDNSDTPSGGNSSTPSTSQDEDNNGGMSTPSVSDTSTPDSEGTGLDESDYKWKETEFTKLVPKPDFGLLYLFESFDGNPLSAQIHNCTDEQIEAYMESVRAKWSDGEIVTDADGRLAIKRSNFGVEVVKFGGTLTISITKMQ
jgi:predicted small lipoprotein YifL